MKIWRWVLAVLAIGLCTACSSFDARWKTASAKVPDGRWAGRWTSEKHRTSAGAPMGGRLRAVITPAAGEGLTVYFHANWLVFSSNYTMELQPKPGPRRAAAREFSGTQELPKMFGGVYHYDARLVGDRFDARYSSSYDHGTFALQRVGSVKDYDSGHARH